jgi:predicted GNAT family acetyltransferase
MTEPTVERQETDGVGLFVLLVDGVKVGTLDYHRAQPQLVHVDYVEVSPRLRGTGLGRVLVQAAADWARENGVTLVPICGYARSVLTSDPAFADVLGS